MEFTYNLGVLLGVVWGLIVGISIGYEIKSQKIKKSQFAKGVEENDK